MASNETYAGDRDLAGQIRVRLKAADNRRLLSRLPLFQPANDDHSGRFRDLLARLDQADKRRN